MGSGPEPYRLLVTGSRKFADVAMARAALFRLQPADIPLLVVHGDADRGFDLIAKRWALERKDQGEDVDEEAHPANWEGPCRETCKPGHRRKVRGRLICPAAGDYRNQEMADAGARQALAALRSGAANKGTRDCIRRIRTARIPLAIIISEY